jgi:hypothetical protein
MHEQPIRFLVYEEAGEIAVAAEALLLSLGLETEAQQKRVFGDGCRPEKIVLRLPLRAAVREIERQCLVLEEPSGWRYDVSLEPQKRAAVMITAWSLEAFGPPSEAAFLRLPRTLAKAIDTEIAAWLWPLAARDGRYWRRVAAAATAIRSGEAVYYGDLPEGVKEYYRWKQGWPLEVSSLDAMHAEDAATFTFCLRLEAEAQRAEEIEDEVNTAAEETIEVVRQRLSLHS